MKWLAPLRLNRTVRHSHTRPSASTLGRRDALLDCRRETSSWRWTLAAQRQKALSEDWLRRRRRAPHWARKRPRAVGAESILRRLVSLRGGCFQFRKHDRDLFDQFMGIRLTQYQVRSSHPNADASIVHLLIVETKGDRRDSWDCNDAVSRDWTSGSCLHVQSSGRLILLLVWRAIRHADPGLTLSCKVTARGESGLPGRAKPVPRLLAVPSFSAGLRSHARHARRLSPS